MRNIIFQYYLTNDRESELPEAVKVSSGSFKQYAIKYNADYLFTQEPYVVAGKKSVPYYRFFEILRMIYDPYFEDYDNVLYIDTDIFPHYAAPNIFDVPYEEVLGIPEQHYGESAPGWWSPWKPDCEDIKIKFTDWGAPLVKMKVRYTGKNKQEWAKIRMLNTGVFMMTKDARLKARKLWDNWEGWPYTPKGQRAPHYSLLNDQPYINCMLAKYNFKVLEAYNYWNLPPAWWDHEDEVPIDAYFYHFSGLSKKDLVRWHAKIGMPEIRIPLV